GRDPDRRAQHAELQPPLGGRPCGQACAAEARAGGVDRGAADGRGVRREGRQRAGDPLRARHHHVRAGDALHPRHQRHSGAEAGVGEIRGWDVNPDALAAASERGALEAAGSLDQAVSDATLVVVAAPVAALPVQVAAVLAATTDGTTVTDVGSTKTPVTRAVSDGRFIGGHPVCGSEAHGAAHATGGLFRGATWFLTPDATTDPERYRRLHGFVASLGAVPVAVDPQAHDRLVALTSHLPHALANVILNQAGSSR